MESAAIATSPYRRTVDSIANFSNENLARMPLLPSFISVEIAKNPNGQMVMHQIIIIIMNDLAKKCFLINVIYYLRRAKRRQMGNV